MLLFFFTTIMVTVLQRFIQLDLEHQTSVKQKRTVLILKKIQGYNSQSSN